MKHSIILLVFVLSVFVEATGQTYIETTRRAIPSYSNSGLPSCDSFLPFTTFDLEPIDGTADMDIAIGQSLINSSTFLDVRGFQCFNNNGSFSFEGNFLSGSKSCALPGYQYLHAFAFGKLRPSESRRDLAIAGSSNVELRYNSGSSINSIIDQTLTGTAVDLSWGPFDNGDNYEDLAVTSGSQVRIYPNLNNGYVDSSPYTFSISASKVVLAQMNKDIYDPTPGTNKADLISANGSVLSVRINDGSNGLGTPQDINVGFTIASLAVADFNNDNFNDVVVVGAYNAKMFLNNGSGTINTTATWSVTPSNSNVLVAVGDLGEPNSADRNDGWNDIVLVRYEQAVDIYINQRSGTFFSSTPEQTMSGSVPYGGVNQVRLADVQNTGGLSLISSMANGSVKLQWHTGNPAPAPPKGVTGAGCPSTHPVITWAANGERDIEGYNVYKYIGDNQWLQLNEEPITENTYTDYNEDVTCNDEEIPGPQSYRHYRVTAEDNAENESSPSASVSILVNGAAIEKRGASGIAPTTYALNAAYPNPFNPSTQIEFDLPEDAFVSLNVFDVLGRKVGELANGNYAAGYHTVTWNASSSLGLAVSGGVYFARLAVTDNHGKVKFSKVNKLILMK